MLDRARPRGTASLFVNWPEGPSFVCGSPLERWRVSKPLSPLGRTEGEECDDDQ